MGIMDGSMNMCGDGTCIWKKKCITLEIGQCMVVIAFISPVEIHSCLLLHMYNFLLSSSTAAQAAHL
jgi:hypothetical protein